MALVMHSNLQNSSSIRLALSLQNHSSKNTNSHLIIYQKKKKIRKLPKKIILKSHAIRVDSSLLQIPQLYFDLWKHHPTKLLVSPSNNYKYPRARWVGLIWRLSPNSLWDLLKSFPEMLDPQVHVNPKVKRKSLTTDELVRSSKTLGLRAQKTVLLWFLVLLNLTKPTKIFRNLYSFYSDVGMSTGGLR